MHELTLKCFNVDGEHLRCRGSGRSGSGGGGGRGGEGVSGGRGGSGSSTGSDRLVDGVIAYTAHSRAVPRVNCMT